MSESLSVRSSLAARLRELIEEWRSDAKEHTIGAANFMAIGEVEHSARHREAAGVYSACARQLADALHALKEEGERPFTE